MGSFSIWHWLIVLLVIILVFGTSKLKNIGKDMGGAIKGFKERTPSRSPAARSTCRPKRSPERRPRPQAPASGAARARLLNAANGRPPCLISASANWH